MITNEYQREREGKKPDKNEKNIKRKRGKGKVGE